MILATVVRKRPSGHPKVGRQLMRRGKFSRQSCWHQLCMLIGCRQVRFQRGSVRVDMHQKVDVTGCLEISAAPRSAGGKLNALLVLPFFRETFGSLPARNDAVSGTLQFTVEWKARWAASHALESPTESR